jgi:hypothetical protein
LSIHTYNCAGEKFALRRNALAFYTQVLISRTQGSLNYNPIFSHGPRMPLFPSPVTSSGTSSASATWTPRGSSSRRWLRFRTQSRPLATTTSRSSDVQPTSHLSRSFHLLTATKRFTRGTNVIKLFSVSFMLTQSKLECLTKKPVNQV